MEYDLGLVLCAVAVVFIAGVSRALVYLTWRPYATTMAFRKQGVGGPGYKFWSGSNEELKSMQREAMQLVLDNHCHDITLRVQPQYRKWISQYGDVILFWFGPKPRLLISDPEMVKQVLANKFGFYHKPEVPSAIWALLGKGLVLVEGSEWARHRRVVNPAFKMDKLKLLTGPMAECAKSMLEGWSDLAVQAADGRGEIEVAKQFQELTADIISHTAFGSSYVDGKEVFFAQKQLQMLAAASILDIEIPGHRYLPTDRNITKWKLERRVKNTLVRIIRGRLEASNSSFGNDLLGVMMEASQQQRGQTMSMDEIIDECKTFFFAGHETTSHLLTWAMFLLSTNPDWQERLRAEVLQECGLQTPNADVLNHLKLVTMVLLETLRLYGPVVQIARKAGKDMVLGNISIPKDTAVMIPIMMIHRSKEIWGEDANEFNPLRFENGISKAAAHPNALLAFSIGPRACIGQDFAMLEAKTVMAMILQRFSFSLSPKYVHAPVETLTLQPQFGLPIVFTPLHAPH
ncbi:cytochrome P450 [Musa troglodytarum]|uniref:Cytochrome P450 n=1 Tax=Musa troglodytarum TaxID=320322 RepID=A0A9E7EQJ7_9LILI|nr:cytochrome P450 [Musa troglodytarum]